MHVVQSKFQLLVDDINSSRPYFTRIQRKITLSLEVEFYQESEHNTSVSPWRDSNHYTAPKLFFGVFCFSTLVLAHLPHIPKDHLL